MVLETPEIVALGIGLGIVVLISLISFFIDLKNFEYVTTETLYYVKKWCMVLFILLLNAAGCALVYYTQNLQVILFIIVVLKAKDIIMAVMFVFNMIYRAIVKKYHNAPSFVMTDEIERIIAFIPVFEESEEQVKSTVDSVLKSKRGNSNYILTIVVSDGKNNYDSLLDNVEMIKEFTYRSWLSKDVSVTVSYGTRNSKPVVFITKQANMGKKDSIILLHELFNVMRSDVSDTNKQLREELTQDLFDVFGVNHFDYIFCTDGDTVVDETTVACLLDTIKTHGATATCGIVNVDKTHGNVFWNYLQNFQYMYGQYIRRTNEDLLGQVLCLPGCVMMVKIGNYFKHSLDIYSELSDEKNLFSTSTQFMGTDRRFTSSIVYTTPDARILQDTRGHVYTVPPQNLTAYFKQRTRWTHNTFFNSMLNIIGPNVNILSRFFNLIDVLRMCLVYFRLFNTLYFVYLLIAYYEPSKVLGLVPYIVLSAYPAICFLVYALFNSHLRKQYLSLFVFLIVNKLFSMFSTILIFSLMLFNIGNTKW